MVLLLTPDPGGQIRREEDRLTGELCCMVEMVVQISRGERYTSRRECDRATTPKHTISHLLYQTTHRMVNDGLFIFTTDILYSSFYIRLCNAIKTKSLLN